MNGFRIGDRVQLHPATDLWMRGARYGTIERIGRKWIHVHVDVLDKIVRMHPSNLLLVD